MTYIPFLLLFCSFPPYICIVCLPSCMVNKYIQRRGVTLKFNRSRSLKMGPIDRSYSRACVTITSSGVCFVSMELAITSFRRQVLSTLRVQRWRGSSGNVRLSNLLISSFSIVQWIFEPSICFWLTREVKSCRFANGSRRTSYTKSCKISQMH